MRRILCLMMLVGLGNASVEASICNIGSGLISEARSDLSPSGPYRYGYVPSTAVYASVSYQACAESDHSVLNDLHPGRLDFHAAIFGFDIIAGLTRETFEVSNVFQLADSIATSSSDGMDLEATGYVETMPEPATLTLFGLGALALAAAAHRRRKRGVGSLRVQAAVEDYLANCTAEGNSPFRLLGKRLSELAGDANWSKSEIDEFYDEVVLAIHAREIQEQEMERAS